MATVKIPLLMNNFTGGARVADVSGSTLEEVISALDEKFPGIAGRIRENGQVSPTVTVTVDGRIAAAGLATPIDDQSEVRLLPSLGGG